MIVMFSSLLVVMLNMTGSLPSARGAQDDESSPAQRAVRFLAREVPRWREEHDCYSCHNNGDAARALYLAVKENYSVPSEALHSTNDWLAEPGRWDDNGGNGVFDDRTLARIQFANALLSAQEAGLSRDRDALLRAGNLVASDQSEDGSWRLDVSSSIGSPATYGRFLSTWAARRVLLAASAERFRPAIEAADRWLRRAEVKTVLDAAAVVLALGLANDAEAMAQRRHCLDLIVAGRAPSGGWGPYVTSAPEPFDTAVVLLGLLSLSERPDLAQPSLDENEFYEAIRSGRMFLVERQLPDGSWPETTRPAGQVSYAQYISTSGWATLALLVAEGREEAR
ncbi:MAG: hypothetical protein ACRD1X_15790 [Vicinamibacteria bacterium]